MPDSFFASNKPRKRKRDGEPSTSSRKHPRAGKKVISNGKSAGTLAARGASAKGGRPSSSRATPSNKNVDEELESDASDAAGGGIDEMDLRAASEPEGSGDEVEDETPAEKRLRLAKLYLESVKEDLVDGDYDAAEIDKEIISTRLKQDVMEHSGKIHLFIADNYDFSSTPVTLRTRGHRFSITSAVATDDAKWLFTAGKEGSIIQWDLSTGKRRTTFFKLRPGNSKGKERATEGSGHTDEVLALAVSSDSKYLVSGGRDRRICLWDIEKAEWIKDFGGHKDTISALVFRKGTHQLYSGSFDRTIKVFDMSPSVRGYVETLFGHQDSVLALDALRAETAVSVGARDKTARFWKIIDETQLVFRGGGKSRVRELLEDGALADLEDGGADDEMDGHTTATKSNRKEAKVTKFMEGSLECIAMIDETMFVTGGDSGSLSLWSTQKKKPIFTQALAHGLHATHSATEGLIETPRWITSLASLRHSDLFASGSWEGSIRLWKLDGKLKSFSLVGTASAPGVVNSLQFITPHKNASLPWIADQSQADRPNKSRTLLIAGLGQEHRFGRWIKVKEDGAANCTLVFALS